MSPPDYQSQLAYHQNQQYGFQGYMNPRNTQPHFFPQQSSQPPSFSQQSSQPQSFPQHSSQPQFKIPQAQEPREPKRKQKRTGKHPVIELDEGDENEDMEIRRLNIRWNNKEEILLAESWIEHSQDANIGKDQRDEIYWNKIFEDFHDRTTENSVTAQREKDLAIKKFEEMKFLMIDTSNLPPHKRAFIEMQQAEIMKKYEDAGADDAGADD
ncbi:hypothetical protein Tco_0566266 [Tanacetum coccineum]